jgi:hypothetical protein
MSGFILLAVSAKEALMWGGLGVLTFVGLLAVISPRRFAKLANCGSQWIDTSKVVERLDKPIHVDRYILPFSRLLGAAVILAVVLIGYLHLQY